MKSFVLVFSLSLFVYRESVHMPAKKKKDPFCRSGKRASRKDQDNTKWKLFPKQRKIKMEESDRGSYYSQTEQRPEEFDVEVEVGASAKKISRIRIL